MAVGFPAKTTYANGDVFSASDINDTNGTLNLLGSSVAYTAGKNKIINGDFRFWQRGGTSSTNGGWNYFADRFQSYNYGGTFSPSRQSFTPGTAPVAGYESEYFLRINSSLTGSSVAQPIEDVRTLAGQIATISLWAKSNTSNALTVSMFQVFGSGGSGTVTVLNNAAMATLTTSWVRYTYTVSIPSISGKTVGTSSNLFLQFNGETSKNLDVWGVQLEAGSTATAFQTATGTIQGELAACQRYFQRFASGADATNEVVCIGQSYATTASYAVIQFLVPLRVTPTMTISSAGHFAFSDGNGIDKTCTTLSLTGSNSTTRHGRLDFSVASGLTVGQAGLARSINASSTMDFSSEL